MIEICIGTTVVQSILDVIFQRIEKTSDMETAAHETQFARSQIMGMRRIVAAGDEAVSGGRAGREVAMNANSS